MSQYPPTDPYNRPPPLAYAQAYVAPKLRPTSVTVLAIIGIIWSALMLLGALLNSLRFAGISFNGNNPILKGMEDDRMWVAWTTISAVAGLVMGVLLLGGSIWSLRLNGLGRSWMIWFSWINIVSTPIGIILSITDFFPKMSAIIQNSSTTATPSLSPGALQAIMQASMWGGLLFSVVALVFPALILYYMSRPHVKEAFARGMIAPPQFTGYPPPPGGAGSY